MKRIIFLLLTAFFVSSSISSPAHADDTYPQTGAVDKVNAGGVMSPGFDLTDFQLDISPEGKYNFFISTKGKVTPETITSPAKFEIRIDTNLDKKVDFTLSTQGISVPATGSIELPLLNEYGNQPQGCKAYVWVVSGYLGMSAPVTCFGNLQTYLYLQVFPRVKMEL